MSTSPLPAPSTPSSPSSPTALDRFFDALRRSPVRRSDDRVVAGVCAGVAHQLGVSSAIVRVGAVLALILGPGLLLYLAAWLLLPRTNGRIRLEQAVRDGDGTSIVMVILAALAIVPSFAFHLHRMAGGHFPWLVVAAAVVAFLVFRGRRDRGRGRDRDRGQSPASGPQDSVG